MPDNYILIAYQPSLYYPGDQYDESNLEVEDGLTEDGLIYRLSEYIYLNSRSFKEEYKFTVIKNGFLVSEEEIDDIVEKAAEITRKRQADEEAAKKKEKQEQLAKDKEITERNEKAEYERLKAKFEK